MPGFRSGASANQLALCLNPGKILGRWLEQTKVATGSFVSPNPGRRVLGLFHSVETQLRCALVKSTKSDCNGTRRNTGSERSSAWLEHLLWEQQWGGFSGLLRVSIGSDFSLCFQANRAFLAGLTCRA